MQERKVTVENKAGIHCRPASRIAQKAAEFKDCVLTAVSAKGTADLSSILSLISLGLQKGDEVEVKAEGKEEEKACEVISELFAFNFDFPPRS